MSLRRTFFSAPNLSRIACGLLVFANLPGVALGGPSDGIYAVFDTTLGSFTCRLDYVEAPMTVANFVGLAEGSRTWLDKDTGQVRNDPFYDGLIFHRVDTNPVPFVIQGGSPTGDGSGGPGFTFLDEFDPALRHSTTGILSMANSGPNSNGSQFFITLAATPFLDDVHSVFGEVVEGLDVVLAISSVLVDANDKPLTDVVMNNVTILRCGAAAEAFDVTAYGLPVAEPVDVELARNGADFELVFPREIYHEYLLHSSPDLQAWTKERIGLYVDTPPTGNVSVTETATNEVVHVFTVPSVEYQGPLYTPPSNANGTFVFDYTDSIGVVINGTMIHAYNSGGTGFWTSDYEGSGTILFSSWVQQAYRARLFVQYNSTFPWDMDLVFASPTNGVFSGDILNFSLVPIFTATGTFTVSFP